MTGKPTLPRTAAVPSRPATAMMDGFVSVFAGTVPVPEFFGPENTERIMTGAAAGARS